MAKIAILGFGTVGSGVYDVLCMNAEGIKKRAGQAIETAYISDLREFPGHSAEKLFTKNFEDILNDDEVTVVVEVIGGTGAAYEFTKKALAAGKSVVTSNKELVATHGAELLKLAEENAVSYLFEAAVGGGIPVIHPLHQCLAANEITEIFGILNGTTNYILTRMIKDGQSFEDALKNAQELGYAEANPAADVEGTDACRKIAILADLAFGKQMNPDKIETEGITQITSADVAMAESFGGVVKLIGYCRQDGEKVYARVAPMIVPGDSALSGVDDVFNAILVRGNAVGDVMFYGKGAGKLPTASAVAADIIDAARRDCRRIMWEDCGDDFMITADNAPSDWLVRAKKEYKSIVEKSFEGCSYAVVGDEIGFVAKNLTQKEMIEKADFAEKYIRILK